VLFSHRGIYTPYSIISWLSLNVTVLASLGASIGNFGKVSLNLESKFYTQKRSLEFLYLAALTTVFIYFRCKICISNYNCWNKGCGSKPGRGDGALRTIKIRNTHSFGWKVKPETPCHKILRHVKITCVKWNAYKVKFSLLSSIPPTCSQMTLLVSFPEDELGVFLCRHHLTMVLDAHISPGRWTVGPARWWPQFRDIALPPSTWSINAAGIYRLCQGNGMEVWNRTGSMFATLQTVVYVTCNL
jgi:hypothetical protein